MEPRDALRAWTGRFIDYATAKLGMAEALRAWSRPASTRTRRATS
jgi:hypothetical protein